MSEGDGGPGGPRDGGKEDVLASIRRIVSEESHPGDRRDGVLTLTPEMRVAEGRAAPPPSDEEDPPLTLSAEMRVHEAKDPEADAETEAEADAPGGGGGEPEGEDAAGRDAPEPVALRRTPPSASEPPAAKAETRFGTSSPADVRRAFSTETPSRAAPMDDDALRDLIRRTIREELSGEMGARVSANIRLLVEREVRKAVEALAAEAEDGDGPDGAPKN